MITNTDVKKSLPINSNGRAVSYTIEAYFIGEYRYIIYANKVRTNELEEYTSIN